MRNSTGMALKILLSLVLIAGVLFLSVIGILLAAFSGHDFILWVLGLAALALIVLIPVTIFKKFIKPVKIAWIILLVCTVLPAGIYTSVHIYDNSIPVVYESHYIPGAEPFSEYTARLDGRPALRLTGDLPHLDSATALCPVMASFVTAVYPREHTEIAWCSGTRNAYDNLMDGSADIIFVARPSKQQLAAAEAAGVQMLLTPIGKEAFVFFVNGRNRVNGLAVRQIKDIYSGRVTNWREVGGKDSKIRAFQRNEGSGSQTVFLKVMGDTPVMAPPENEYVDAMAGMVRDVADYKNYRNAIGYSFRYYVNEMVDSRGVKILSVEGIYPDRGTIRSGTYPFADDFYAVTLAGNDNPQVKEFMEWMIGAQGQELVEKTGYVAVK